MGDEWTRLAVTTALLLLLAAYTSAAARSTGSSSTPRQRRAPHGSTPAASSQLLVLLLDGFRWDYLDLIPDHLGGFVEFVKRGVRAEHVNGIFPTLSYPSWTTLSTGLYAESHGILGNYFYHREEQTAFELHARNEQEFWWQSPEPIWTTATRLGLQVGTVLWSRSEVPVRGLVPKSAQGYEQASNWTAIEETLRTSFTYLQNGYNLVMAYGEHIDNVGHKYGPKSTELKMALIDVGKVLERFFYNLTVSGLRDKVNVLLVSDHGMTDASGAANTHYHQLHTLLDPHEVALVMDQGALAQIYITNGNRSKVFMGLQDVDGVKAYTKSNIPKNLHFGSNPNAPDILLMAEKGHLLIGSPSRVQVPEAWITSTVQGVHGYEQAKVHDMRTVFMATGPAFPHGAVKNSIELVDIYQVYCCLLGLPAQPHNGSWLRVKDFFLDPAALMAASSALATTRTCLLLAISSVMLLLNNHSFFTI